ncbi:secondary thiamine-phosphate synthase enzyme YjbQ [Candidatus Omnitrophota bacterium]
MKQRYNASMLKIPLKTKARQEIVDITALLQKIVREEKFDDGVCVVYSPHTTGAISVNENADPDVKKDLTAYLNKAIPQDNNFAHMEGNSDAHIKGSLMGFSQTFIVEQGTIQLGTWQGIFFMEFDGPRNREIWLKLISAV